MVRVCGVLNFNDFQPCIFTRWLVEVTVDADVFIGVQSLGFRVNSSSSGFWVKGSGFRVLSSGFSPVAANDHPFLISLRLTVNDLHGEALPTTTGPGGIGVDELKAFTVEAVREIECCTQ